MRTTFVSKLTRKKRGPLSSFKVSRILLFVFMFLTVQLFTKSVFFLIQNYSLDFLESAENRSQTAVICCVARDEEAYIDEWADYYLALGFSEIFIYDNNLDGTNLDSWQKNRRLGDHRINVIQLPGSGQQYTAYLDCAKRASSKNHTWAAFFDIDEFLVIRNQNNIVTFLSKYCQSGALSINWYYFGFNNLATYWPLPVTKRFNMRVVEPPLFVKSVVKLSDMNMDVPVTDPHYFHLKEGFTQHDTNNKVTKGSQNENGPMDIAVIHHYWTKSKKEWRWKSCHRGRATIANISDPAFADKCNRGIHPGEIFDNTAWMHLKKLVPWYAMFDQMPH